MSPTPPRNDPPPAIEPPPIAASLGGLYNAWVSNDLPESYAERELAGAIDLVDNSGVEHLPDIVVDTRRERPGRPDAPPAAPTLATAPPTPTATPASPPPTPATQPTESAPGDAQPASGGLLRSSMVMASGTIVSRLMGVLRVVLLAHIIGLNTVPASVWDTANNLPNLIYLLLAGERNEQRDTTTQELAIGEASTQR